MNLPPDIAKLAESLKSNEKHIKSKNMSQKFKKRPNNLTLENIKKLHHERSHIYIYICMYVCMSLLSSKYGFKNS